MPLSDLLDLGKHLQSAVERVARVLIGQEDSRRRGPKPAEITATCRLEVVALNRGSFEIALDLPRDILEGMHLGFEAVEAMLKGCEELRGEGASLPPGYDLGVLHSLRDLGGAIGRGIDAIEIRAQLPRFRHRTVIDRQVHTRIVERIRGPVASLRTVEGLLLMADFRHDGERCRIHPPAGEPITCTFDDSLEETVYQHLRTPVRVVGEAHSDPSTGRISSLKVRDIEPLSTEVGDFETVDASEFWTELPLEQLAAKQGVTPVSSLDDLLGAAASLWASDEEFEEFLEASKGTP